MKAYVVPSGRRLYPFDDGVADWRVLDRPLPELQRVALARCGLTFTPDVPERETPCVVMSDALFATPEALALFLEAARRGGRSVQAAAAPGLYAERVLWHMARDEAGLVPLPLWYVADAGEPVPLPLSLDEEVFELPVPVHVGTSPGKRIETLLTRYAIVEIESWINLYQASIQGLMAMTRRAKTAPWWVQGWAFARGGFTLPGAMAKMNRIGKNCDIHPTAVVELCEIGDNVRIGAGALVRTSVIGDGAMIDDHASVRACVVGAGAAIANNNNLFFSVVYPDAFLVSGPYQYSLFGRACAIMHCICCDTRLDGKPVIADVGAGVAVDSRQRYLGSCYGHGVRAGAGSITAPGRAIPNFVHFLPPFDAVVTRVPPDLPVQRNVFTTEGTLKERERRPTS